MSRSEQIRSMDLSWFATAAAKINDSDALMSVYAAPEWECLSEDGQQWVAALVRETLAMGVETPGFIPSQGPDKDAHIAGFKDEQSRQFIEESDRIEAEELARRARVLDPGQRAYLARWEGHTLGPSGASPAWENLQPCAREIWAKVERACVPAGWTLVPVEAPEAAKRAGTELALRISLSASYHWHAYMADLWRVMHEAVEERADA